MIQKSLLLSLLLLFVSTAASLAGISSYDANAPLGFGRTVTGGAGGKCVTVSSASELASYLSKSEKYEIYLDGAIQFTSMLTVKDFSNKTIYGLPGSYLYSDRQDASTSGILYFRRANNVIMRNVTFKSAGAYDCDGNDNFCLDACTNIWIDHCDFQDGVDGNFDCKEGSDNICVSWCRFRYLKAPKPGGSGGSDDHRYTDLWGSSDNKASVDGGKLNTTFVFCWWDEGCVERMPRVRFGKVHLVNCLWNSSVSNYCVGLGKDAMAYVEKCAFIGVQDPLKDYDSGKKSGGKLVDCYMSGVNVKNGTKSDLRTCTFDPSSYYTNNIAKANAQDVYSIVSNSSNGAGATLSITACGGVDGSPSSTTDPTEEDKPSVGPSSEFTDAPAIKKRGSGSSSQTVELGSPIEEFRFEFSNCTSLVAEGLPQGIMTTIKDGALCFSGTPTEVGTFDYTLRAVGGISEFVKEGQTITVVSTTTKVEDTPLSANILLSPSVLSNELTIFAPIQGRREIVTIVNLSGLVAIRAYDGPCKSSVEVDCSSLSRGIYIVKVDVDGSVRTEKIVKK